MGSSDGNAHIDTTLRALGTLGRYQILQLIVIKLGNFGAAYQLLDNIFIGRAVTSHQCTPYNSSTSSPDHDVDWNNSYVTYGECEITVSKDNLSEQAVEYPCLYGHDYGYRKDLSFMTEFDLVCDRKLLGSLVQSCVIMGQGFGAVLSSIFSDRFGRKKVLVASQFGLLTFGVVVGFAPHYAVLVVLKCVLGAFQQGVVSTSATMTSELIPTERRAVITFFEATFWAAGTCSMPLFAFLLQDYTWRYLQLALSSVSLLAVFQWWYLDEPVRWLINNGKEEEAIKVLKRSARANRKNIDTVLQKLKSPISDEGTRTVPNGDDLSKPPCDMELTALLFRNGHGDTKVPPAPQTGEHRSRSCDAARNTSRPSQEQVLQDVHTSIGGKQTKKMTFLDIFRHRRLVFNASILWFAWFTTAFSFFALYMMSTGLHGNRFVNSFLTSLMEFPQGLILYFLLDRVGRKGTTRPLFALSGIGLLSSGLLRHFGESSAILTLSVVAAMLGMVGASGVFGAVFFYTPELFPTNMRNQAVGISSFAGRIGGMIAPFMADLADIAVWAPGAMIGTCCFAVVVVMHFLPETKGRELPDTIEDIEGWYQGSGNTTHIQKDTRPSLILRVPPQLPPGNNFRNQN